MRTLLAAFILTGILTLLGPIGSFAQTETELNADIQAELKALKVDAQSDSSKQCLLGLMYENGLGVDPDISQAVQWYQRAAKGGNGKAMFNLANMYQDGQGVTQDYAKAVQFYEEASGQGVGEADYNLGVMYRNGEGVEEDLQKAAIWFIRSAERGEKLAQYELGIMNLHASVSRSITVKPQSYSGWLRTKDMLDHSTI